MSGAAVDQFGTSVAYVLVGDTRPNVMQALGGNDILSGQAANDRLCGGPGRDRVRGQLQSDRLFGKGGRDRLNGGPGKYKARKCERGVGI